MNKHKSCGHKPRCSLSWNNSPTHHTGKTLSPPALQHTVNAWVVSTPALGPSTRSPIKTARRVSLPTTSAQPLSASQFRDTTTGTTRWSQQVPEKEVSIATKLHLIWASTIRVSPSEGLRVCPRSLHCRNRGRFRLWRVITNEGGFSIDRSRMISNNSDKWSIVLTLGKGRVSNTSGITDQKTSYRPRITWVLRRVRYASHDANQICSDVVTSSVLLYLISMILFDRGQFVYK